MTRCVLFALLASSLAVSVAEAQVDLTVPASIERNGWTIFSARAKPITTVGKSTLLKRAARTGGALEKLALGDAYAFGCRHYARITPDATGMKNALASALFSIDRDPDKAERWYRKAIAAGGYALPLIRLGDLLRVRADDEDPGASADDRRAEAYQLYRRAAEAGSPEGMLKLADAMRLAGEPTHAWRAWYTRAAHDPAYPNFLARLRLADLLIDEGQSAQAHALVDEDYRGKYAERLASQHTLQGAFESYVDARLVQALTVLAEQGDRDAMLRLADGYYPNLLASALRDAARPAFVDPVRYADVRRDMREAARAQREREERGESVTSWLERAAEAGHPEAQFRMGNWAQGKHDEPQPGAVRWFRLAAVGGHPAARERLEAFEGQVAAQEAKAAQLKGLIDGLRPSE